MNTETAAKLVVRFFNTTLKEHPYIKMYAQPHGEGQVKIVFHMGTKERVQLPIGIVSGLKSLVENIKEKHETFARQISHGIPDTAFGPFPRKTEILRPSEYAVYLKLENNEMPEVLKPRLGT